MSRASLLASAAFAVAFAFGCSEPVSNTPEAGAPSFVGHFLGSKTSCSLSGQNLVCTFKEAGLPSGSVETVTLNATGSATYQCINGGGENPNDQKKTTVSSQLSVSGQFTASKSGNIVGTLTLSPPGPGSFSCPNGQTVAGPTNVSYTIVTINDATSGASLGVSGSF